MGLDGLESVVIYQQVNWQINQELQGKDCDGYKDYEYYMHLDDFTVLKKPLSASKMKELTKQGFPFRTTMFYMSEECKDIIMKEIKKNYIQTMNIEIQRK